MTAGILSVSLFGYSHKELNEVLLVFLPYAVIYPGAVVVHTPDTVLADTTVVGSGWYVHLTPANNIPWIVINIIQLSLVDWIRFTIQHFHLHSIIFHFFLILPVKISLT